VNRTNLAVAGELGASATPDLLGRFVPVPYRVYLQSSSRFLVLLETNDCMLISQAGAAGFRLVRGNGMLPFRWRLLRDWKRPAQPIGVITSLRSNNCFHISLGSGSCFSVDSEFKEAFGFLGVEVTRAFMVRHIFPLLSSLSLCATYAGDVVHTSIGSAISNGL
jgi:hypothetical protein